METIGIWRKTLKKKLTILLIIPALLLIMTLGFLILLQFTPKPLFSLANLVPLEANLTPPDNFHEMSAETRTDKEIPYSQYHQHNRLDIYRPKKADGPLPVLLFIHGGGFFKGDKDMATYFGPAIASNGYAFVSIDYDLAPNATIFQQLQQVNEAVKFISDHAATYGLDPQRINLSGSSAGGFLALQLLSAYHDKDYAAELELATSPTLSFRSLLLYSAVFDLSTFQKDPGNPLTAYLMSAFGWGLTGEKNWQNDRNLGQLLNLNHQIAPDFPPLFITDGNTKTFTTQAKNYVQQAEKNKLAVETLFFPESQQVGHGYQLQMDTPAAAEALEASLAFLKKNQ